MAISEPGGDYPFAVTLAFYAGQLAVAELFSVRSRCSKAKDQQLLVSYAVLLL